MEIVDCHYPIIHRSNQTPYHFLHGFIDHLNDVLDLDIRPTAFKGDIYVTEVTNQVRASLSSGFEELLQLPASFESDL